MEEFKGTKGEWTVKRERGYDIDVTNKDGDICWLGLSEFTDETKLANAKLIAAAPELLAFAIEMAKRYPNSKWIKDQATEAINKALN